MQETKPKPQQTRSPTKGVITNAAKALVILITAIAMFYQDLTALFTNALKDQAATYLLFIPILFAYLVYRKRRMLKASIPQQSNRLPGYIPTNILTGILLLLLSLLLYWYGSYTSASLQYHILSLPVFIAGSLLFLFNTATMRQLLFPTAYLTLLTPPSTETLQISSTAVGISSAIGFIAIVIFTAYLVRDRLWKKAVIFLTSLPIITILIGFYQGTDLAQSLPLTIGIWALTILGTPIIIEAFAELLKTRIFTPKTQKCMSCNTKHSTNDVCPACSRILKFPLYAKKSDIAKIAAVSLAVILILYMQASVLALTRAHPEITIPTTSGRTPISTAILPQLTNYTLKFIYRDQIVEQKSKQNASLLYAYYPTDKTKQIIWVAIGIASSTNNLPKWETNLNTSIRTRAVLIEQTDIQLSQITCHYLSFKYTETNTLQTVLYWYDTSTFKFNSTSQQKHAEISLVTYPQNINQLSTTKDQLIAAANSIVNYWQPIKTWSQISLIISQNGDKLVIVASAASVLSLIYPFILARREKRRNTINYQKLSKENQQTIQSVYDAQKTSIPTLSNIVSKYANITGKPTTEAKMLEKLSQFEKIGLMRREVGNRDDEPTQTWKTMCICE
jgi:hypothetical protein